LQRFQLRHGPDSTFLAVAFIKKNPKILQSGGRPFKPAALLTLSFDKTESFEFKATPSLFQ
jgi:hypothetical protein